MTDARESSSPEIETYALYWLALDMRMFIGASTYLSCFMKHEILRDEIYCQVM